MRDDQGGSLNRLNDVGDGKCLPGARHAQENLVLMSCFYALDQFGNGLCLIALRYEFGHDAERIHETPALNVLNGGILCHYKQGSNMNMTNRLILHILLKIY